MWIAMLQLALADMTVCFDDNQGAPIVDARVSHTEWGWVNAYVTDHEGCVDIATWSGFTPVTLHAENRVVKVVSAGLPSQNVLWSVDGQNHVLSSDDYVLMAELARVYDGGLAGVGPFDPSEPTGTYGEYKITADLNSVLTPQQAWVEAVVSQEAQPRLHLNPTMFTGSVVQHEMMHALHFASVPASVRASIELEMAAFTIGGGRHALTWVTTPGVAWVEGVAHLGTIVYLEGDEGCWSEACWSDRALSSTEDLLGSGDDAIEGVVAGILFGEFAADVGFDYVLDTVADCASRSLQDYATCIADLEGRTSETFGLLRQAARPYGVTFDAMPPGDWSYCNAYYPCASGEGDCDEDDECVVGSTCIDNVGRDYGWSSGVDVCELTVSTRWMYQL